MSALEITTTTALYKGKFGAVFKATRGNNHYVFKRMMLESKQDGDRAKHEIDMLALAQGSDYVCKLRRIAQFTNCVCIVMENYPFTFEQKIKWGLMFPSQRKQYILEILSGLLFLREKKIIHRNLSPRNILLNGENQIKIADFGNACLASKIVPYHSMDDINYRAIEILMGTNKYGYAADMWSLGCIYVEILTETPLFTNTINTTRLIHEICSRTGKPLDLDVYNAGDYPRKRATFSEVLCDKIECDVINRMLEPNHTLRISIETAISTLR